MIVSRQLEQYTERTRRWEESGGGFLRVGDNRSVSIVNSQEEECKNVAGRTVSADPKLGGEAAAKLMEEEGGGGRGEGNFKNVEFSTPPEEGDETMRLSLDETVGRGEGEKFYKYDHYDHLNHPRPPLKPFAINLEGCRKVLTIRIIGAQEDEGGGKFNVWCMDGESETEWLVVGRSWDDFKTLRRRLTELRPSIGQVVFPKEFAVGGGLNLFGNRERVDMEGRRLGLEKFMRKIGTLVYTSNLHPQSQQIMHTIQEFLKCEVRWSEGSERSELPNVR